MISMHILNIIPLILWMELGTVVFGQNVTCPAWITRVQSPPCESKPSCFLYGKENVDCVTDPAVPQYGEPVVRVLYPKGSYAGNKTHNNKGGVEFFLFDLFFPGQSVTFTYELYFSRNFKFALGGKLPGLFGGEGQCAGGVFTNSCFSARFMWRTKGDGEIYGYLPNENSTWFCNNSDVHCNFKYGHSFGRGSFRFKTGQWQKLGQKLDLNNVGNSDGRMGIFYQGKSVYQIEGLHFRNDDSLLIDKVFFSTFFGGSSSTDWASQDDVHIYFRNLQAINHDDESSSPGQGHSMWTLLMLYVVTHICY